MVLTDQLYRHVFHFCGRVGIGVGVGRGGGEKLRLKLTSAKVEIEVEAELDNIVAPPPQIKCSNFRKILPPL